MTLGLYPDLGNTLTCSPISVTVECFTANPLVFLRITSRGQWCELSRL